MDKPKPPPQQVILPSSILDDISPQSLQLLFQPFQGVKPTPAELNQNDVAALAFHGLIDCFAKAGKVCEGELKDLIWGFAQCGFDDRAVAAGLTKLRAMGYIYYTDPMGVHITEHNFDPKKRIWLRYADKFLNLLVRA